MIKLLAGGARLWAQVYVSPKTTWLSDELVLHHVTPSSGLGKDPGWEDGEQGPKAHPEAHFGGTTSFSQ